MKLSKRSGERVMENLKFRHFLLLHDQTGNCSTTNAKRFPTRPPDLFADCFDEWQLMELAVMPESSLPYGQYMFLGLLQPPKGWVAVQPNECIVYKGKIIEKFIPQEPQLSEEDYESGGGVFP